MATPLPQLSGGTFLCDGGLETTLIFQDGVDLPHFAAFVLLDDQQGRDRLERYYTSYLAMCADTPGAGFVLDTPTWRANPDWAAVLGLDAERLRAVNTQAARWACALRERWAPRLGGPLVVCGVIGPRGDGYVADAGHSAAQAADYQGPQAEALAAGGVDMLAAVTMTTSSEALGVSMAVRRARLPASISFTVETNGGLPSGEALGDAIARVDASAPPAYFAINCAHPTHFAQALPALEPWVERNRCIRANASEKSHAELDEATELDIGDPLDLAQRYRGLKSALPRLSVWGGCCGTDLRHLRAIRDAMCDVSIRSSPSLVSSTTSRWRAALIGQQSLQFAFRQALSGGIGGVVRQRALQAV